MSGDHILLEGVRTHNLRNVTLRIPKNRLVAVTGVSGSGKSSLIHDTLYRYARSLYLGALAAGANDLGDGDFQVDHISGVQPPIALEQSARRLSNPRSTIGTLNGVDRMLRVLFARCAAPVCPVCFGATDGDRRCASCGCFAEPLAPQNFSSNHRDGMCAECGGMGRIAAFSEDLIIPDRSQELNWIWDHAEPATFAIPNVRKAFEAMCAAHGVPLDSPYESLSEDQRRLVLYGSPETYVIKIRKVTNEVSFEGIINHLDRQYRNTTSAARREAMGVYLGNSACPSCHGARLRPESAAVRLAGRTLPEMLASSVEELTGVLRLLRADGSHPPAVADLLDGAIARCANVARVGLGYLSLDRAVATLSGGELQRVLLAQHVGTDLTGVMYVLDEPSIGLHPRDAEALIETLRNLRDLGNSVIVIEHDEQVIRAADWVVEVGPGAGEFGGTVTFEGEPEQLLESQDCVTGLCLARALPKLAPRQRSFVDWYRGRPVHRNNLDGLVPAIPVNALTCVTGVSGAGKSSLVHALYDEIASKLSQAALEGRPADLPFAHAVYVEQRPIGRSSRSTIATYVGIADDIRDRFVGTEAAEAAGFDRSQFSVNVPGGRCETCKGLGEIESDIYFLKNDLSTCPDCGGRRFQKHVLAIAYLGKSIHDVMKLTVKDARDFFANCGDARIAEVLGLLIEFGVGYLRLGQSTTTLSGGEAQRINLASELAGRSRGPTLYIFDEPTRGLHLADLDSLIRLFFRLLSEQHTVLIIEHNMHVVARADHVVDIGPEGGEDGGQLLFAGPPDELMSVAGSHTGRCLAEFLGRTESAALLDA